MSATWTPLQIPSRDSDLTDPFTPLLIRNLSKWLPPPVLTRCWHTYFAGWHVSLMLEVISWPLIPASRSTWVGPVTHVIDGSVFILSSQKWYNLWGSVFLPSCFIIFPKASLKKKKKNCRLFWLSHHFYSLPFSDYLWQERPTLYMYCNWNSLSCRVGVYSRKFKYVWILNSLHQNETSVIYSDIHVFTKLKTWQWTGYMLPCLHGTHPSGW